MIQNPVPIAEMSERDMVARLIELKREIEDTEAKLKLLETEDAEIRAKLSQDLLEHEKDSTARYEGVGFVTLKKPKLFARCDVGDNPRLFEFLKEISREDVIKPQVHYSALTGVIDELIKVRGTAAVPPFINYGYIREPLLYPRP